MLGIFSERDCSYLETGNFNLNFEMLTHEEVHKLTYISDCYSVNFLSAKLCDWYLF